MDDPSFFVRLGSLCFFLLRLNRKQPHNHLLHVHRRRGWFLRHANWNDSQYFFFFHMSIDIFFSRVRIHLGTAADDTFSFSDISSLSLLLIFLRVCFGLSHRKISSFPPLPFLKIWRAPRFTQTFLRLTIIFMRVSSPGYHHHRIFFRNYFPFSAELGFSLKSIW